VQTFIKELAAEAWAQEQMRLVHVQLLAGAYDCKQTIEQEARAAYDSAEQRLDGVHAELRAQQEVVDLLDQHGYLMGAGPINLVMAAYEHAFAEYRNSSASHRAALGESAATGNNRLPFTKVGPQAHPRRSQTRLMGSTRSGKTPIS
jgi:hypothetical protein